jgi:putative transposase
MPTLSRHHQIKDNIAYHVFNRGNRKLNIFHEEEDYESFKEIVRNYILSKGLEIFHYSLIPNHYHLELELECPEKISSIMSGVNRAYTHYHHKKYQTAGYLWQGRFVSKAVEKDNYLIRCGGYIEMNPVRANLVKSPEEYRHSSSRYYVLGEPDALVTEDPGYSHFGRTVTERQKNYLKFLVEMDHNKVAEEVSSDVMGSKSFRNRLRRKNGRLIPRRNGKPMFRL